MARVPIWPISSVRPSGSARATISQPSVPPPPGRFSTITVWPNATCSLAAISRARMSVVPPGVKGTIRWSGCGEGLRPGRRGDRSARCAQADDAAASRPVGARADAVAQRGVVQRRVLARRRDAHGVLQARRLPPFLGRPRAAVGADLVDAPVEFEVMAVGIEELDRDLAAGAAAAFVDDLGAVLPSGDRGRGTPRRAWRARRRDDAGLPAAGVAGAPPTSARQWWSPLQRRNTMPPGIIVVGIDVGHLEAEHLGIEVLGLLEVGDNDHGVADLLDGEGRGSWATFPAGGPPSWTRRSKGERTHGEIAQSDCRPARPSSAWPRSG